MFLKMQCDFISIFTIEIYLFNYYTAFKNTKFAIKINHFNSTVTIGELFFITREHYNKELRVYE